jgi:hypothetical protein
VTVVAAETIASQVVEWVTSHATHEKVIFWTKYVIHDVIEPTE